MAKNVGNYRKGQIANRSQFFDKKEGKWAKRDTTTGQILSHKQDGCPYKDIEKE